MKKLIAVLVVITAVSACKSEKKEKKFDILVNGDDHEIDTKEINYDRVVDLYLGSGGKPSAEYLVKYSHGPNQNPSGTLAPGQKVKVKDGMRFRVAGTGES